MTIQVRPDEKIFAEQEKRGEVESFPDIERGWGLTFEQSQGIPPMEWFNGLFQRTDQAIQYLLQHGIPEWSATQHYPANAYVQYNGKTYRAVKESQNAQPTAISTEWALWSIDSKHFTPKTLTASTTNHYDETGHSHEIDKASTTQAGIVQLTNNINSDSETHALTAKAGKTLSEQVMAANNNADSRVKKSGDTMIGTLTTPNVKARHHGHGSYAHQYSSEAPFLVEQDGSIARDTYHPFIKGRVRANGAYGAAFSLGYSI